MSVEPPEAPPEAPATRLPRPPRAPLVGPEPPFDMGDTGRDLFAKTEPVAFADPRLGWPWAAYMAALAGLLDVLSTMVRDDDEGNEGWTALASPSRCPPPYLRVLAQWAGIRAGLWSSMSEADLRELIGPHAPGQWRGTRKAMIAAVRRFLPPGEEKWIYFEERADGDPYKLRVFLYDWIPHDAQAVTDALWWAKPAGIFPVVFEVRHGQAYFMLRDSVADYAEMFERFDNYAAVFEAAPTIGG
jgi:hypothetical protein